MLLILGGLAVLGPIVLAARGAGYRGLYFGAALITVVLAMLAIAAIGPMPSPTTTNLSERRGTEFINDYAPALASVLFAMTFGCLVGGCVFRRRHL